MSQDTFRIALGATYKAITGVELERAVYGKPEQATYKSPDEVVSSWMEQIHKDEKLPKHVYMNGDNPASDIVGGNTYGGNTCLVRTGVYQGAGNDKENPASFGVFENVLAAVKTAIRKGLGDDFHFEWGDKIYPVTSSQVISAME
ncbi:MAG: hypothetical protein M1827_004319 [Pycnora praestabilis]|nr:MAG: hypothetical protein M1827_004319 [Pycnora praestabilis]